MFVIVLTGAELRSQPGLQQRVFKLRHKIFVEALGWTALRRPDGLETDAFDLDTSIHFLVLALKSPSRPSDPTAASQVLPSTILNDEFHQCDLLAYTRLLPTTQPHLLANLYPHLLNGDKTSPPQGPNIWEWTRMSSLPTPVAKDPRNQVAHLPFSIKPVGRLLIAAVIEWALANKIDTLTTQLPPQVALVMEALGGDVKLLAEPSPTEEGVAFVPMSMGIGEGRLRKMKKLFWGGDNGQIGGEEDVIGMGRGVHEESGLEEAKF